MNIRPITQTSAIVTAICAGAFLLLAVFTAMRHQSSLVTAACSAATLASILVTNFQLRVLHDRKARQAEGGPPPA